MMVAVRIRMKKRKGGPVAVICKKKTSKSEDVVAAKSYVVVRICPVAMPRSCRQRSFHVR